jgi:hypothetical protein
MVWIIHKNGAGHVGFPVHAVHNGSGAEGNDGGGGGISVALLLSRRRRGQTLQIQPVRRQVARRWTKRHLHYLSIIVAHYYDVAGDERRSIKNETIQFWLVVVNARLLSLRFEQ